ncbi:chitin binding domain-containing protein [Aspergillus coremiiformis]|uniref:Chitin binding domain-containing protein n=1 Tax=Aspergillus coremiiformis TaxID=138285 RepID=A0A5N6ZEA4_9EURO|nr:chitin binding domain-containing protein [Aspergillus coremiiformis]
MKQTGTILALAGLASMAHGHGFVTTPKARMPGTAFQEACGQQMYYNQKADNYGNIQGELQIAKGQSDYNAAKCNVWLCKGFKFEDNKDNVFQYTPGQTVSFDVDVRAPHTGVANVSVVDTTSNTVIGQPLKSWTDYASVASGVKESDKKFSVTLPTDLGSKCSKPGACVLQWYWFAQSIDQTYESCVDFTVGGSGAGFASVASQPASSAASVAGATASSTATGIAVTSTPKTGNNVAAPSGFATSAKPSATSVSVSASSPAGSTVAIPIHGTAEEKLNWVASLLQTLIKYTA